MRQPRPELATEKAELVGRGEAHSRKRPATAGNPSRRPNNDAPRRPGSSGDVRREMEQVSISALLLLEITATCQQRIGTVAHLHPHLRKSETLLEHLAFLRRQNH